MGVGAPKGHKKWGGRKKGTPNKPTQELLEKAREIGCDPFEVLLRFAKGDWEGLGYPERTVTKYAGENTSWDEDVISPELRAKCAADACQYLYAKRKAVELSGPDGEPVAATVAVDLTGLTDEELRTVRKVLSEKGQATG